MVLPCPSCGAQNFVAPERRAAQPPPPRCWRCGDVLPADVETPSEGTESNRGAGRDGGNGGGRDA